MSEASTTIFSPDRKILLFTKVLEQRSSSRRLPMMKAKVISSLRRIAVQNSGVRRLILQRTVHSSRHQVLHQFRILMEFLLCLGKQPSARMAMERSLTPVFYGDAANGFSSKSKSVGTATTTAIAMWIEDAECRFWIRASYSGKTADSSYDSIAVDSHRTVNYCVPDTGQFVQCIV